MAQTFVLVAGAWLGSWAWQPLARELSDQGFDVVVPAIPGTRPGDDPRTATLAQACDFLTHEITARDLHDCVLVAHDWSGFPVTAAANRVPSRLSAVIFWSAYVPEPGRSHLDEVPPEDREILKSAAAAAGGYSTLLPFHRWQNNFIPDAHADVQRLTYSMLCPQPWAHRTGVLDATDCKPPPVAISYLTGTHDLVLPHDAGWATKFAPRLPREPIMFDGTHTAHLTQPKIMADALTDAARRAD